MRAAIVPTMRSVQHHDKAGSFGRRIHSWSRLDCLACLDWRRLGNDWRSGGEDCCYQQRGDAPQTVSDS